MKKKESMFGFKILRFILKPIFILYYNPIIVGKENIPRDGAILICANHIHVMDQCMALIATKRVINYMAKKEYFDGSMRWFFKMAGCISVNRQIKDRSASKKAIDFLNIGGAVGLFPEGTRNKTKDVIQPFKFGAVSMAKKTGAKIVPCGIYGEYKFRSRVTIVIGKPFYIKESDSLEKVNEEFQKKIVDLIYEAKKIRNKNLK